MGTAVCAGLKRVVRLCQNRTGDNRFPRASALFWRTLEEWIVDNYVTQYNQRLDEWMNAHTRR
jgi:hypothetical protein